MSANEVNEEENPPVPNWLLKLEEQREKRLKARLGHEAGAGAKCQKCGDKCPGLDLHFWRKICKACKCGKEDHDIVDDDIYGFIQFQLLGSKPVKPKGIFLKGRSDELILEWTPRGSANDVGRYLSELPADQLPVRGSAAAKLRKQRLQRQLPAHDIDASLCHQLTEEEVNELQEYVSHIRNNCVGQGKIIRLSLFKGHQHKLTPSNPQFLSQIPPAQLASSQTVSLQSSDISNNLQNMSIRDNKQGDTPQKPPLQIFVPPIRECVMDIRNMPMGNVKDYSGQKNVHVHPLTTSNVERHQEQFENYSEFMPNYLNPLDQHKDLSRANVDKVTGKPLANYNPNYVNPVDSHQIPSQVGQPKDVKYPTGEQLPPINNSTHPLMQKDLNYSNMSNIKVPLQQYNPNFVNPVENTVLPSQIGQPIDLKYPNKVPLGPNMSQNPINANIPLDLNVYSAQIGAIRDQNYPNSQYNDPKMGHLNQNPINANISLDQNVYPAQIGAIRDHTYSNPQLAHVGDPKLGPNSKYNDPKMGHLNQNPINANIPLDQNIYPAQIGAIRDQTYPNPQLAHLGDPKLGPNSKYNDPKMGHLNQNPINANNPLDQNVFPAQTGVIRDQTYPNPQLGNLGDPKLGANSKYNDPNMGHFNQNPINTNIPLDQNVFPAQIGAIRDQTYPNPQLGHSGDPNFGTTQPGTQIGDSKMGLLNQNPVNANIPLDQNIHPAQMGGVWDQTYPNSQLGQGADTNFGSLLRNKPNIPIFEAQNAINPFETQQNLQSVGFIRDIEHPLQNIPQNIPKGSEIPTPGDPNSNLTNLTNQSIPKCHACKELFEDGSVAIAADRTTNMWHAKCFNCHSCQQPLADLVYFYHKDTDNVYCGRDYAELKGIPRCQACDELIFVKEYCLAEDKTFHIKHFCCFECDEPLAGKQYILENNQPVCIACYESLKAEKCNDCCQTIKPDEQGVSLNNLHWHAVPDCFACKKCRKSLLGNKMLLRNNNLFCSDLCFKSF